MTEIETIARAQMYLEKLANGVNPLTDTEVNENDVVNNVRISRCLFYVSGILKQITGTGIYEIRKTEFTLTPKQLADFHYSEEPITISEITKRLNHLVNPAESLTLKNGVITDWLTSLGMLTNVTVNNKNHKRVTEAGTKIGIIFEQKENQQGQSYIAISYNSDAQHFIIDNIDTIIAFNREREANKRLAT